MAQVCAVHQTRRSTKTVRRRPRKRATQGGQTRRKAGRIGATPHLAMPMASPGKTHPTKNIVSVSQPVHPSVYPSIHPSGCPRPPEQLNTTPFFTMARQTRNVRRRIAGPYACVCNCLRAPTGVAEPDALLHRGCQLSAVARQGTQSCQEGRAAVLACPATGPQQLRALRHHQQRRQVLCRPLAGLSAFQGVKCKMPGPSGRQAASSSAARPSTALSQDCQCVRVSGLSEHQRALVKDSDAICSRVISAVRPSAVLPQECHRRVFDIAQT
jgi:hypothetical protein